MQVLSKQVRYKCDKCGKRVVFGKHFCNDEQAEKTIRMRAKKNYILSASAAILIIAAFTWSLVGSYSLFVLLLLPIAVIAILLGRGSKKSGNRYRELVSMVGGDDALARRLVDSAQRKFPDLPEGQLVSYAIEKLQNDRNR